MPVSAAGAGRGITPMAPINEKTVIRRQFCQCALIRGDYSVADLGDSDNARWRQNLCFGPSVFEPGS